MNEDITLPLEVANGRLKLAEIGAIFVLFSLPKLEEDLKLTWSTDDYLARILQSLIDNKLIEYTTSDGNLEVHLNIKGETIAIEWETDYDNDRNVIYHLYSRSIEDLNKYTVKPKLSGNKLLWSVTHSSYKHIDELFDNLEDAKQFAEDHKEEEYIQ